MNGLNVFSVTSCQNTFFTPDSPRQRRIALNIHFSCCVLFTKPFCSHYGEKERTSKPIGRDRHCVWQIDGSIWILCMSHGKTLIPVPVGMDESVPDIPARQEQVMPEPGALDSVGLFLSFYFRGTDFSSCFFLADQSWPQSTTPEVYRAITLAVSLSDYRVSI